MNHTRFRMCFYAFEIGRQKKLALDLLLLLTILAIIEKNTATAVDVCVRCAVCVLFFLSSLFAVYIVEQCTLNNMMKEQTGANM